MTNKQLQAQEKHRRKKEEAEYKILQYQYNKAKWKTDKKRYSPEAYKRRQEYKKEHRHKGNLKPVNVSFNPHPAFKNYQYKPCFNCNGWVNGKAFNVLTAKQITQYFNNSGIAGIIKHYFNNTETNKEAKKEGLKDNVIHHNFKNQEAIIKYCQNVEAQFKHWREPPKLFIPICFKINTEDKKLAQEYFKGVDAILKYYGYEIIVSAEHYNEYHKDKEHKGQAHKHYLVKNYTEDKTGKITYGLKEKRLDKRNLKTIRASVEAWTKKCSQMYNIPYNKQPTKKNTKSQAHYTDQKETTEKTRQTGGGSGKDLDNEILVDADKYNKLVKDNKENETLIKKIYTEYKKLQQDIKTNEELFNKWAKKLNCHTKEELITSLDNAIDNISKQLNNPKTRQDKTEKQTTIRWGELNNLPDAEKLKLLDNEGKPLYIQAQVRKLGEKEFKWRVILNKESKQAQERLTELAQIRELKAQGRTQEAKELEHNSRTLKPKSR